MKQLKSLLLTTIIIASISSCGYQLRGSVNIEGLENVKIIADNKNSLTRILEQKLLAYRKDSLNESQMQGTRERENTAIESINRNLVRKLLLKFKAGLQS